MAHGSSWPYPPLSSAEWLRADGRDPALNAVRQALVTMVTAERDGLDDSEECLVAAMTALADLAERIDWALLALIGEARGRGMPWSQLGAALGISKQAVNKRFGPYVAQALTNAQQKGDDTTANGGHA